MDLCLIPDLRSVECVGLDQPGKRNGGCRARGGLYSEHDNESEF